MKPILWFSLRFLLLYAVLQTIFLWTPLNTVANRLVASTAAQTLRIGMNRPVLWSADRMSIQIRVPIMLEGRQRAATSKLEQGWYTRNLPMFLAIVLAGLPALRPRLWAVLGLGTLALVLLDGWIVAAHAWGQLISHIPPNAAYHLLWVFGTWSLGGMFVAPMFVATLLSWKFLARPLPA